MAERTADVQAHWTRPGVLARLDAALTELGHDPQKLTPEILATVEHLHSGGLATTGELAKRIALTEDSRVLDVGCGIGGPARYLAHSYGCRVDGIDLTAELIETGRMLTGPVHDCVINRSQRWDVGRLRLGHRRSPLTSAALSRRDRSGCRSWPRVARRSAAPCRHETDRGCWVARSEPVSKTCATSTIRRPCRTRSRQTRS